MIGVRGNESFLPKELLPLRNVENDY